MKSSNWRHLPAALIAVVFLLPLYFMVSGSLRKAGLPPPRTPELLPSPLAWGNYERAFELVDLPRYTLNSLIVVAFAVPLTLLTASWAGVRHGATLQTARRRARRALSDRADGPAHGAPRPALHDLQGARA